MTRYATILALLAFSGFGQSGAPTDLTPEEQQHLSQVLSQGSSSAVDLIHAFETHLAKYPDSPKKNDIERAILKAAIQANDNPRVAQYGERVLRRSPDDVTVLDAVCRALVLDGNAERVKSGVEWSKHYETLVRTAVKEMPPDMPDRGRRTDEADRMLSHALLFEAIGAGVLGDNKTAADIARKSFEIYPSVDPALELARRSALLGKTEDAVRAYADAFTVSDPKASDADRSEIRRRLGEIYRKAKGSEAGLGDVILQAYDRNLALLANRKASLKHLDPNMGVTNPLNFTISGVGGEKLALSSLLGKVVVMDFWATWCGPCRTQHPLYEKVKQHFASNKDVVFLAINSDEDRSLVKPFLEEHGWKNAVYFEEGLVRSLKVDAMPTTVVFGKSGSVVSRMNGFNPEDFVEVLIARINEALAK